MSNVKTGTNLYFDSTTGASVTGQKRVIAVFWVSNSGENLDIAEDDDFLLTDADGVKIIGKRAEFAGDDLGIIFPQHREYNGLIVATMDGGVCHIWLEQE